MASADKVRNAAEVPLQEIVHLDSAEKKYCVDSFSLPYTFAQVQLSLVFH